MLQVTGLAAVRGDRRLFAGLDFLLQRGELLYVRGPNGSGKTTLLRMLCGLVAPEAGEIRWQGEAIRGRCERYLQQLFYLGHLGALKDELTAIENLRISASLSGREVSEAQALQALHGMELRACEDLPVKVLSQGQKRRVALARLLLSDAALWILDEPFTALDQLAIDRLQAVMAEHLMRGGIVVLTTHQEVAITAAVMQVTLGIRRA